MELNRYCEAGDLAALQAYCAQANVTAAQIREYHALQIACLNNHLEVAQWLYDTFALSAEDAIPAICEVCGRDNLYALRWIQQTWGLSPAALAAARAHAPRGGACAAYLRDLACGPPTVPRRTGD